MAVSKRDIQRALAADDDAELQELRRQMAEKRQAKAEAASSVAAGVGQAKQIRIRADQRAKAVLDKAHRSAETLRSEGEVAAGHQERVAGREIRAALELMDAAQLASLLKQLGTAVTVPELRKLAKLPEPEQDVSPAPAETEPDAAEDVAS